MSTDHSQHKPELFLDLIRRQQRGRLKIYLGFAAGVGKTFDMLQEGNRLRRQGMDVVVGFVETHGRAETAAQIGELEQVPRQRIEYRGILVEEMDLDAVLARRPTIALVDELAHTNVPGSRNPKRYQDVEELLHAGISVITTLNIQHLESLHDIVRAGHRGAGQGAAARLRGRHGRPDRQRRSLGRGPPREAPGRQDLSGRADPDGDGELLHAGEADAAPRVGDGGDRLPAGPLAARTEQRGGESASGSERVMVCLSSRSPQAAALLRKAARIADRLGAPWYAVYVQTPREAPEHVDAATQRQIGNNLELARQLGGTSLAVQGGRPGQHDRFLRQGIRDHAGGCRADAAAVVSPLVRPLGPRPPGAKRPRRGRDRGGQWIVLPRTIGRNAI